MKKYFSKIHPLALLLLVLAFISISIPVPAFQSQTEVKVSGTVMDENNDPIIGANILVKGTNYGVVTDLEGDFELSVPVGATIKVSFIGMTPQEHHIENTSHLSITLTSDISQLGEVVVIGYGSVEKKDLTGAIETLSGEDLTKVNNTNFTETLNGKVTGVLVTKSSNRPGADMAIQIRGLNSIHSSNEPLYVINGVPSYSGMKHLNAEDIESIDILKDASSSAIYGSRGANGVVIITTKGATRKEGFSVEYSGSIGLKTPTRIPDMIGNKGNGYEYTDYRVALWRKKYGEASLSRPDFLTEDEKRRIRNGEFYDWLREISGNSLVTNHHINTSGGSEKTSYSFGIGYSEDNGMVGSEKFRRATANIGLEHRFNDKLTVGTSTYLSNNKTDHGAREMLLNAYFLPPIVSPYDESGEYAFIVQPTSSKINPFIQSQNNIRETEAFYANFSGFIEVKPVEGLSVKSLFSNQFDSDVYGEWIGTFTQQKSGVNPNEAFRQDGRNNNWVWDNIITYKKAFNEANRLDLIGLFSMQKDTHQGSTMRGEGLPFTSGWHAIQTADEIRDVTSYYWESSMTSYMLRANYSLKDRYLLTFTGRYDGTSRLRGDNQWGFLPSVALGWRLKNEAFLKDLGLVDELKLRLSYGKTGNNNLAHDITWSKLDLSRYTFAEDGTNGFGLGSVKGNPGLQWEMTSEYNLGLDFGLLNNRIFGTIDLYSRLTEDLIFSRSVGAVNGFSSVYQNIGSTTNKGIEIALNTVNISNRDFSWKTRYTFSLNRNKIKDLYGDRQDDLGNRWFIGKPIHVIYDFKQLGIWQEEEAEEAAKYGQSVGHIKVEDLNGDYNLDEHDFQIIGSPMPDWTAGMTNTFIYQNFDLYFDIYARYGGTYNDPFTYMFTAWDNEHWNKLDESYWTNENRSNSFQEVGAQSYYTQVLGNISGTFVKVQNITLGYAIGEPLGEKLGLQKARVYASVQNPFIFTDYVGADPEIIGENVNTQLSLLPMTFTFGLNVNF